ncbi:MAG: indolepyruvate ferredoxin oxidoreductase subunit alpha [Candidatus Thorarchaeota archaeon]
MKELLAEGSDRPILLLGNEAIVRGAIESAVRLVATYPGTPASEIGDRFCSIASELHDFYFEFSTNEKVALEVAGAAAIAGVRSMMVCKGPGINVAADPFLSLAYVGVRAGLVIVVADDPSMWSSQNENDSRYYALMANMPMIEPSDPSEARSLLIYAFDLSERLELPVLFRTTTRVNHTRAPVSIGPIRQRQSAVEFRKEPFRFVPVPAVARERHKWLLEKIKLATEISNNSPANHTIGNGDLGVVTSGVSYNYVLECTSAMGISAEVLKLGMTHPVPDLMLESFMKRHSRVLVVEELEPFLETQCRRIANIRSIPTEILGKEQGYFPRLFEYTPRIVAEALSRVTGRNTPISWNTLDERVKVIPDLPPRPPILCAGCPHRATYYAIRVATRGKAIYPSDIGCYTLSISPPLETADILFDMGSSITTACGIARVTGQDVVATIGDSTFFASGLPGLVNAVYNRHPVSIVVLDNRTTAMTGHQPHPGTGVTGMKETVKALDIAEVARGLGVEYVQVVHPFDSLTGLVSEVRRMVEWVRRNKAPAVLVSVEPCALLKAAERRRSGARISPFYVDPDLCVGCGRCLTHFSCPAIHRDTESEKAVIDRTLCNLCGACGYVCPKQAIKQEE